jgi:hypothetical protein
MSPLCTSRHFNAALEPVAVGVQRMWLDRALAQTGRERPEADLIQNTKRHFEPDDQNAFDEAHLVPWGAALELVMRTIARMLAGSLPKNPCLVRLDREATRNQPFLAILACRPIRKLEPTPETGRSRGPIRTRRR